MPERISPENTFQLLFNDASKTIADLKSRQWQATALAVAGIIGIDSAGHRAGCPIGHELGEHLIVVMVLVAIGHGLVIWRCSLNLKKFRDRMVKIVRQKFDPEALALFPPNPNDKKDPLEDSVVADEGTIVAVAVGSVWFALGFACLDVWGIL